MKRPRLFLLNIIDPEDETNESDWEVFTEGDADDIGSLVIGCCVAVAAIILVMLVTG
jgi:hypothetical protein